MPDTIFTSKNILKAYLDCRRTKRRTLNALKYELEVEDNILSLKDSLLNRSYHPGRSICFVVTTPKPREIFAADFCDRVVHHILINQVEHIWEKQVFIDDSYACRFGRGHHYGVSRLLLFASRNQYYGQFDISNFFASINKKVLYNCFSRVITTQQRPTWWKEEVLWLADVIIFNNPTNNFYYKGDPGLKKLVPHGKSLFDQDEETGMPIGNLTSQFLANVYLNELDHYVCDDLGCTAYGRYVDDFILLSNSKEEIIEWRNCLQVFLKDELKLTLHPRKQQIQPTRHGIPFVGYFIKPWGVTVRRNVVKAVKAKIYQYNKHKDLRELVSSVNSYYGHLGKAKSAHLRKHLIEKHLSPELKSKIAVVGNWRFIKARKKYRNVMKRKVL